MIHGFVRERQRAVVRHLGLGFGDGVAEKGGLFVVFGGDGGLQVGAETEEMGGGKGGLIILGGRPHGTCGTRGGGDGTGGWGGWKTGDWKEGWEHLRADENETERGGGGWGGKD